MRDSNSVVSHELKEGAEALLVLCRVCFCRPIDMGIQEVGLAFVTAMAVIRGRSGKCRWGGVRAGAAERLAGAGGRLSGGSCSHKSGITVNS